MMMENTDNHSSIDFNVEFTESLIRKITLKAIKPIVGFLGVIPLIAFLLNNLFLYLNTPKHYWAILFSFGKTFQTYILFPTLVLCVLSGLVFIFLYSFINHINLNHYKKLGMHQKIALTDSYFTYGWGEKIYAKISWDFFAMLKRSSFSWQLVLVNNEAMNLPTDQLPPEAQAFILKKLTEHNVPIKG